MSTSWGNFHFWVNNPFNELDINRVPVGINILLTISCKSK